jgi:hypothetical protein
MGGWSLIGRSPVLVRRSPSARPRPSNWPAGAVVALLATALIALVSATAPGGLPSRQHAHSATSPVAAAGSTAATAANANSTSQSNTSSGAAARQLATMTSPRSGGAVAGALNIGGAAVLSGNRANLSAHVAPETDDAGGDAGPAVVPAQVNATAPKSWSSISTEAARPHTPGSTSHHRDRAPPTAYLP